jgi:hypothetical protein
MDRLGKEGIIMPRKFLENDAVEAVDSRSKECKDSHDQRREPRLARYGCRWRNQQILLLGSRGRPISKAGTVTLMRRTATDAICLETEFVDLPTHPPRQHA